MSIIADFAKYEVKLTLKLTVAPTILAEDFTVSLNPADATINPVLVAPKEFLPDTRTATKIFPLSVTAASLPELINSTISVQARSPTSTVTPLTISLTGLFFGETAVQTATGHLSLSIVADTPLLNDQIRATYLPLLIDVKKTQVPQETSIFIEVTKNLRIPLTGDVSVMVMVDRKKASDFLLGDSLVFAIDQMNTCRYKTNPVKISDLLWEDAVEFRAEFLPAERVKRAESPEINVNLNVRPVVRLNASVLKDGTFQTAKSVGEVKGVVRIAGKVAAVDPKDRVWRLVFVLQGERAKEIDKMIDKPEIAGFVLRYHKPNRVLLIAESADFDILAQVAEKLTYDRNTGKVLFHPQCYWAGRLYQGWRSIRVRRGVQSLEMIDFFIADSIFQLRDKFPSRDLLDALETLKGEAPSVSPVKRKKSRQEVAAEIAKKIDKLKTLETYRDRDVGREFEARLRSNALDAPFNVVNGTYVPRLKDSEALVKVSVSDPLVDKCPAPWRHVAKDQNSMEFVDVKDFFRYGRDGRGSRVQRAIATNTGHVDLWR
jgi:hypothetical protein